MATKQWKIEHREEQRSYQRKWYSENKSKQKRIVNERRKQLVIWFRDYKSTLKCSWCPETHPATLDFHHLGHSKKDLEISQAIANGWGKVRILKEISKCLVLCCKCHRIFHWNQKKNAAVIGAVF